MRYIYFAAVLRNFADLEIKYNYLVLYEDAIGKVAFHSYLKLLLKK